MPEAERQVSPAGQAEAPLSGEARQELHGPNPFCVAVAPSSPAEQAGLRAGDVLGAIGDRSLVPLGPGGIYHLLSEPPGAKLTLTVTAPSGDVRTVVVVLAERAKAARPGKP